MHKKTFKLVLSKNIFFYFISLFVFWIDIIMNRTIGSSSQSSFALDVLPFAPPPHVCIYLPSAHPKVVCKRSSLFGGSSLNFIKKDGN